MLSSLKNRLDRSVNTIFILRIDPYSSTGQIPFTPPQHHCHCLCAPPTASARALTHLALVFSALTTTA